jgi:hypothetical protein
VSEPLLLLDAVAIVGDYLRVHPVVSGLVGDRVSHRSPDEESRDEAWVRITQLDAANVTGNRQVEHLVSYYLQIDCYAGADNRYAEAFDLVAAVRAALVAITQAELDGAVATDVAFASMPSQPDGDLKPARERQILDAEIFMHPRP